MSPVALCFSNVSHTLWNPGNLLWYFGAGLRSAGRTHDGTRTRWHGSAHGLWRPSHPGSLRNCSPRGVFGLSEFLHPRLDRQGFSAARDGLFQDWRIARGLHPRHGKTARDRRPGNWSRVVCRRRRTSPAFGSPRQQNARARYRAGRKDLQYPAEVEGAEGRIPLWIGTDAIGDCRYQGL